MTDSRSDDDDDAVLDPVLALAAKLRGPGTEAELHNADAFVDHLGSLITAGASSTQAVHRHGVPRSRVLVAGLVAVLGLGIGTAAALGYHTFIKKAPSERPSPIGSTPTSDTAHAADETTVQPSVVPAANPSTPQSDDSVEPSTSDGSEEVQVPDAAPPEPSVGSDGESDPNPTDAASQG